MILWRKPKLRIETERLFLRLPAHEDFPAWANLRQESEAFLRPWEPRWARDHLTRRAFTSRVYWAARAFHQDSALPLFLFSRETGEILGGLTLDNIRRGPVQCGVLGYWIGLPYMRQGYMHEAISALTFHAFRKMDLSRLEAACLPENTPSRGVLEKCGFKYEGVAQAYLQIEGRWRNHVLYAMLRSDRRGKSTAA